MWGGVRVGTWLERRYGRKAGVARLMRAEVERCLGTLAPFERLDWERVRRLVFVCSGNICRSPYAEARARSLGLPAISFGLAADGRSGANPTVVRLARERGLALELHRSRPRPNLALGPEDLLVAMEVSQARALAALGEETGAQVTLLGLWGRPGRAHLEDPYGLSEPYFRTCLDIIDGAVLGLAERLQRSPSRPEARAVLS